MDLTNGEIRVLGALLEKQRTTPDQYPLSLNALRLACNQSTNRDPVVDFDEHTVREALERLARRRWVRLASAGRSTKYRHLLDDALGVSRHEIAVLAVLMLRGPQTPGELRSRTERMHHFAGHEELMDTIEHLIGRDLVARLGRRPGQKEERYSHLLGGEEEDAQPAAPGAVAASPLEERVSRLEAQVAELREAVDTLSTGVHDHSAAVKPSA